MVNRPLVENMIADSYETYKVWAEDGIGMDDFLNRYNNRIPVWRDMDDNTKQSAIEYVYTNRGEIELHSGCVEAWVQATAYFLLWEFFASKIMPYENQHIELEMFFDDLDFMMDDDILDDSDVQEYLGIDPNFTEKF